MIGEFTRLLTKSLRSYELRVPNDIERLRRTLRKGDVLLVEGDQRVSQVIRYLTQSSWSHSALYVGDEMLKDRYGQAEEVRERFGEAAPFLLVEAIVGEGVIVSPIGKYKEFNIRVCRPQSLRRADLDRVLADAIRHLGDQYDVKHIWDLARYFFPVSLVPPRWRQAALHLGRGSEREVICSSLIAKAFSQIGYPILPTVTVDPNPQAESWWRSVLTRNVRRPRARFRAKDPALITPRDFDLSPYFDIVKFNHLADANFSYLDIIWDSVPEAGDNPPAPELAKSA